MSETEEERKFEIGCKRIGGNPIKTEYGTLGCEVGNALVDVKNRELESISLIQKSPDHPNILFHIGDEIENIALHKKTGVLVVYTKKLTIDMDKGLIEIGIRPVGEYPKGTLEEIR